MATIAEALALAVRHHQAGNLSQAEQIYRQVLQADPANADALHLLGVLAHQAGRPDLAVGYLRQALGVNPRNSACHCNLGLVLQALGQPGEAVACYEEALRLQPDFAGAHYNLGNALAEQRRLQEAVACHREALRLQPNYPAARNNLGTALKDLGQLEEAAACFEEALRLQPGDAKARYNLGLVLQQQGRPGQAEACFREALRLEPGYPEAYLNLGVVLQDQGRLAEAEACFREVLRLHPGFAQAQSNLGAVLQAAGRLEDAEASFRETIRLNPRLAEAHNNLGATLQAAGRLGDAEGSFREAIHLDADYAEAHWNRSLLCLLRGDWEQGWPEYEWRWRCPGARPRPFVQPLWDGSPLGGQTILLHAEQGLGDALQFVRYAPLVKERGGSVLLECQPTLLPLLRTCPGLDWLVAQGAPLLPFELHAPLLSLPGILGTTPDTVPAQIPYLCANPARVERWRRELGDGGVKVGVTWQGNPTNARDRQRSVPLPHFRPLAAVKGVRLFSLQVGPGSEQLAGADFPVTDLGSRLDDFGDTAAVLCNLDLVVTVDTAAAHCAGALGRPVWVALPFAPDWRWLLGREDSPWYPTMRLFRQTEPGDWAGVFRRVAEALAELVAGKDQ